MNHSSEATYPHISSETYGNNEVSFLQLHLLPYPVNILNINMITLTLSLWLLNHVKNNHL